ncbi:MAG: flagellar FlbD family protein [Solirubrobacteraceae bacterium]|jgi:flagellar protein FlbD
MITLHRLGHAVETFYLNPDLIMTVESTPDTVITLTTGTKIVVAEPPERIASDLQRYKVSVLADALARRHELRGQRAAVRRPPAPRRPDAPRPHIVPPPSDHEQTA